MFKVNNLKKRDEDIASFLIDVTFFTKPKSYAANLEEQMRMLRA
jgi:hypothetical protein